MKLTLTGPLKIVSQLVIDEFHSRGFFVYSKLDLENHHPEMIILRFLYSPRPDLRTSVLTDLSHTHRCSAVLLSSGSRTILEIRKSERTFADQQSDRRLKKLEAKVDELLQMILTSLSLNEYSLETENSKEAA